MFQPHNVEYYYVNSVTYTGDPPKLESLLAFRTSENLMNFFPNQMFSREEFIRRTKAGDEFITRLANGDPKKINFIEDPNGDHFVVKGKPHIQVLFDWSGSKK